MRTISISFGFRARLLSALLLTAGLLLSGCGGGEEDNGNANSGQENEAAESQVDGDPGSTGDSSAEAVDETAAVHAAIDDAIRRLKSGDARGFIEYCMPIESLQRIRETNRMERVVGELMAAPERVDFFVQMLETARANTPEINEGGYLAVIEFRDKPKPKEEQVDPPTPKYTPPETTNVKLEGFGDDLNAVIQQALETLGTGQLEDFVLRMFPAGELRRPDADNQRKLLLDRLKANPSMVESMIADLNMIADLTPEFEDGQKTAVFQTVGQTVTRGNQQFRMPDRTFKLQLVEGSWRLFDHTTGLRETIARQVSLPLRDFTPMEEPRSKTQKTKGITLEKFGDDWRLADIDGFI